MLKKSFVSLFIQIETKGLYFRGTTLFHKVSTLCTY